MVFESLLLIDKGRDNLFNDEFRIYIENCFDNIMDLFMKKIVKIYCNKV